MSENESVRLTSAQSVTRGSIVASLSFVETKMKGRTRRPPGFYTMFVALLLDAGRRTRDLGFLSGSFNRHWITIQNHDVEAGLAALFLRLDYVLILQVRQIVGYPLVLFASQAAFANVDGGTGQVR